MGLVQVMDALLQHKVDVHLRSDSTTAIKVARSGITKSMGYMQRTQRVSIGFISDVLDVEHIQHVPSQQNSADMLTKHLSGPCMDSARNLNGMRPRRRGGVIPVIYLCQQI
eukprot:Lankesteria_metandrocarpae@DN9569_c0_g1_i1.p2